MKVGDLVKMKDSRYHKEIGVVTKVIFQDVFNQIEVHWADGRVIREREHWLVAVKK